MLAPLYHGSDEQLDELDGNDPGYTGSLGYGLYLTTAPEHATVYGKWLHEVENPVPEELIAFIEPQTYECGNSLIIYTPGSSPFTFEITDRRTGQTHRYSVLEDCDSEVKAEMSKAFVESYEPGEEIKAALVAVPDENRKILDSAIRRMKKAVANEDRIDDTIEEMAEKMAEAGLPDPLIDAVESFAQDVADDIDTFVKRMTAEALGTEIDLSDIAATAKEHGYSAFYIDGYAPNGDEYVIFDDRYLPVPVTKIERGRR